MNYYVLPGTGIFGGIKVGVQFADLLSDLGVQIAVATPGGRAPAWFHSHAAIVPRERVEAEVGPADVVIFSLPHDYQVLKATGARLVFHCQGTDPLIDPILRDRDVTVLACWMQAAEYMRTASREPIEVGISISSCFFYDGRPKLDRQLAFMPRRGRTIAEAAMARVRDLRFREIDGATELEAASILQDSGYFLATAEGEWFGLPALEAMAAGCVVLSVPVLGGMEFLLDGTSACVVEAPRFAEALDRLSRPGSAAERARLRDNGVATAWRYASHHQRRRVAEALRGPLREALSWN